MRFNHGKGWKGKCGVNRKIRETREKNADTNKCKYKLGTSPGASLDPSLHKEGSREAPACKLTTT